MGELLGVTFIQQQLQIIEHSNVQHGIPCLMKLSVCTKDSLYVWKSLELCSLEKLNIFHPSQFTAQQLLIISSHQLTAVFSLFSHLSVHLNMAVTEEVIRRKAEVTAALCLPCCLFNLTYTQQ